MLCSKCSKEINPVVAIDIDGTLGDYHGHFLRFASAYLGVPPWLGYHGKPSFKIWFMEEYTQKVGGAGVDERMWKDIKLAYRQGGMKRSMPIYEGAQYLCDAVREAGAELWLTTTRPFQRLDNIDPDTRAWLERHDIVCYGLLFDEDKYRVLADHVDPKRVVAVLDDLPEQFEAAGAAFGWRKPILRRTTYNSEIACDQDAESLIAVSNTIVTRIKQWRGNE